jgi:uncharacterized protein YdeI (YjbR/CyaY-like superfamily)
MEQKVTPVFFSDQSEFRQWLDKNHTSQSELLVGFYKVESGWPSMTWSQSVDEAICYGWIDGIRKSIDKNSYCIRFTPRRPSSIWSKININKVIELKHNGLMTPAGLEAFQKRKEENSGIYSYENDIEKWTAHFENIFKSNRPAWEYFNTQALSYKKMVIRWIMSAKQEKTKLTRLEKVINESEKQKRI